MQPKILVIRGGAIGDFLLTLPAITLLREAFPAAFLEILGYEHIIALAGSGGYADATRSIEYAALANFFNPKTATLDAGLCEYFGSFQQVVSYLYDPDGFFAGNLRRCGVKNLIEASPKIDPEGDHAARQLARPLERLALYLEDVAVRLRPGGAEQGFAEEFLRSGVVSEPARSWLAILPGSGSERKNWPVERWLELAEWLLAATLPEGKPRLLVIGGEADEKPLAAFHQKWPGDDADVKFAENLPLPRVAALLARCRFFVGHDSGISHLAGAAGVDGLVLFGPTDPDLWAPPHQGVEVLRANDGTMTGIKLEEVQMAVTRRLATAP